MTDLFLGIDGGGTKTHAAILDASGAEVGRLEVPATLVDPATPDDSIREVIALARRAATDADRPVAGLWAGLAGAGSEPVRTEVEEALRSAGVAGEIAVGTDAQAAFFDAFGDGPGILLVAGTGSVALGRGEKRQWTQVGGWGLLLGDEGSGYAMAMSGLRGVVRAADWTSTIRANSSGGSPEPPSATWPRWRPWSVPRPRPVTSWPRPSWIRPSTIWWGTC